MFCISLYRDMYKPPKDWRQLLQVYYSLAPKGKGWAESRWIFHTVPLFKCNGWHFYVQDFQGRIICIHLVWYRYCESNVSDLLLHTEHIWIAHSLQLKRVLSASDYFTIYVTSNSNVTSYHYVQKSKYQIKLWDLHRLQKMHNVFKFCSEKNFCVTGKNQQNRAWPCNSIVHQQNILSLYKKEHNVLLAQGIVFYFFPGNSSCQKFCLGDLKSSVSWILMRWFFSHNFVIVKKPTVTQIFSWVSREVSNDF